MKDGEHSRGLAELTPERLSKIVTELARSQPPGERSDVSLFAIIKALTAGQDLGSGAEAWSAQRKIKRAIIETLDQVPGMRYIEGDA